MGRIMGSRECAVALPSLPTAIPSKASTDGIPGTHLLKVRSSSQVPSLPRLPIATRNRCATSGFLEELLLSAMSPNGPMGLANSKGVQQQKGQNQLAEKTQPQSSSPPNFSGPTVVYRDVGTLPGVTGTE